MLVTVSKYKVDRKPTNVFQHNEPFSFEVKDLSVEEFAEHCGTGGFFKASIFDIEACKERKLDKMMGEYDGAIMGKKFSQGSNVICLDFDSSELSPQDVIDKLAGQGILPNFYYYSFSQDPHTVFTETSFLDKKMYLEFCSLYNIYKESRKESTKIGTNIRYKDGWNFRVCWCLSEPLTNQEYEDIYCKLLDLCGELGVKADTATKDISRVWWGGLLGYCLISKDLINIKASLGWQEIAKRVAKAKTLKIARIIDSKNNLISEYREQIEFPDTYAVDSFWWSKLHAHCRLWDRYEDGEYLNYNERLTLFTNLKFLKYSDHNNSIYEDIMRFYDPQVYEGHSFNEQQLKTILTNQSLGAYPICIGNDGLYKTVADYMREDRSRPQIANKRDRIDAEESDRVMDKLITQVLDSPRNNYFKSQTATGKTEHIIDYLIEAPWNRKYIVAVPYLNLINEFEERWRAKSQRPIYCMPTDAEYTDMDLARLNLGLGRESKNLEKAEFIEHLMRSADNDGEGVFVITHALLLNLPYIPNDRIIIDENIEEALVKEYVFTKAQLRSMTDYVKPKNRPLIDKLIEAIDRKKGEIDITPLHTLLPDFEKNIAQYIDEVPKSTQPAGIFNTYLTSTGKICKEGIRVRVKTPLIQSAIKNRTLITIFTATPLSTLLKQDFDSVFEVVEAPLVRNKGKIVQFKSITGARGINNSRLIPMYKEIKSIMERRYDKPLNQYYLLTFKLSDDLQRQVEELGFKLPRIKDKQIHLDNCAGLDFLKGKEVIVAGKKDLPPDYYLKRYEDIKGEVVDHLPMKWFSISTNGVNCSCYLYEDSEMRSIQMDYINKIATQAVGRARALREANSIVYYFSDYVIDDVDELYDR